MPMNPLAEDYERLAFRWAVAPHGPDGLLTMGQIVQAFAKLYAQDRDKLPQTDADRAFSLVATAAMRLEHEVSAARTEPEAQRVMDECAATLDEAAKLDPLCHDARRLRKYLERPSRLQMLEWLEEGLDEVERTCRQAAKDDGIPFGPGQASLSFHMRPYLRWKFDLANESLNCGRYRKALAILEELQLEDDSLDLVGARLTGAYVAVKLEDHEALRTIIDRYPDRFGPRAWFDLAELFMAYKECRMEDATELLHGILRRYPSAGLTLVEQEELPQGTFGHLDWTACAEDELFVAMSEAAIILAETNTEFLSPMADWIAYDPEVTEAYEQDAMRMEMQQVQRSVDAALGDVTDQDGE